MPVTEFISNRVKNLLGRTTSRKLVVFSVDDYGNVRVGSKKAREEMDKAGLKIKSRFDAFDALENREDLESLFETLNSVKDIHGNPAVFTPFALPCNIDFEAMEAHNNDTYRYELLPDTLNKLPEYKGTWDLWREGLAKGLLAPQFHGREHLNLKVFSYLLERKDYELSICLKNRSYTSISSRPFPAINYTAAFDFQEPAENIELARIISDGLLKFEDVFGRKAVHFMPPTSKIHPSAYPVLLQGGIKFLDIGLWHKQHQGNNRYSSTLNFSGRKNRVGQVFLVRNCVFEPTDTSDATAAINTCMKQIQAAFDCHKPAVISSHRVNYCGHIDQRNRRQGIKALRELLRKISDRWSDVEFVSSEQMVEIMNYK